VLFLETAVEIRLVEKKQQNFQLRGETGMEEEKEHMMTGLPRSGPEDKTQNRI